MMKVLLWLTLAAQLSGQAIHVTNLDSVTPLNGEWLQQTGDDLRYADPGLDDSSWSRVTMPKAIAPGAYGYTWHRIHLEIPATDIPLSIAIAPHFAAYEIFANGIKIGSFGGELRAASGQHFARLESFPLPKGQSRLLIAIRSNECKLTFGRQFGGSLLSGTSWLGSEENIQLKLAALQLPQRDSANWLRVLCAGLGFGGLFFVMLSLSQQRDREFLWCGLLLLAAMMNRLYQIPDAIAIQSRGVVSVLNFITQSSFSVFWILLLSSLFKRRPSLWVCATAGAAILGQLLVPLEIVSEWLRTHAAQTQLLNANLMALSLPLNYFLLGHWRRQPTKSEWFTHATLITYLATNSFQNLWALFDKSMNLNGQPTSELSASYILLRFPILLMFFAMGLVLNKRKTDTEREQARLQQELSAAAQVQSLLLPGVVIQGVEATYLPASEVGGDFYQAFQTHDKATIALVGDVSGKGLKAAMLVSVAIGAIEREKSLMPETILERLNLALMDRTGGGFVTCCCVRIEASGCGWVASAGHPSPYLRGQEIHCEAGLPLGIVRDAAYQSYEFQLEPQDQLTIVSDGVLESENQEGELFGFDRTSTLSHKSSSEIAQAALAWGQNDDITVVTVRRQP
jgi:phosphoserine phosphatase RsbU/P